MKNLLDSIVSNNIIFACLIIFLSAVLITLIILIIRSVRGDKKINIYEEDLEDEDIKTVKNVKKEDIIESPVNDEVLVNDLKEDKVIPAEQDLEEIDDEEIKERYEQEDKKEVAEILDSPEGTKFEELIKEMESSAKIKPEDVVANFEKEQEAQSIISYKELVDAVKNRQETYYEDELESKPLTTVSNFLEQKNENSDDKFVETSDTVPSEQLSFKTAVEDTAESKFKRTDIISPVFGRMNNDNEPVKVNNSSNTNTLDIDGKQADLETDDVTAMDALEEIYKHMASDLKKNNDISTQDELTKNEQFLQSLKDFRKKL